MGRARGQRRKRTLLIAVAVLAAGIGVLAYGTHLLRRSELQTIDARFSIRGKQAPPSNIELVAINPTTQQELRDHHLPSEFPFPRRYDAGSSKTCARGRKGDRRGHGIHAAHRRSEDNALVEAVGSAHGKTVLATTNATGGTH